MKISAQNSSAPALYDLHLHTFWSYDASTEPELYFQRARELGLKCIAITEHHNFDSATEVRKIAERYPEVRLIAAAELTVTTSIGAVDLLCYKLPAQPTGALAKVLDSYHEWQCAAGASVARGMRALGYDYTEEDRLNLLRSYRPARTLEVQGATHIKGYIERCFCVERGFIKRQEDYPELLKRAAQFGGRPDYPPVERVVPAVKEAGGLVVIAHPTNYFLKADRNRMEALREECDFDGIECAHREVPPELTAVYRQYCLEHGLFSTGGSDSHDTENVLTPPELWGHTTRRKFACHIGPVAWLDEFLERIEK